MEQLQIDFLRDRDREEMHTFLETYDQIRERSEEDSEEDTEEDSEEDSESDESDDDVQDSSTDSESESDSPQISDDMRRILCNFFENYNMRNWCNFMRDNVSFLFTPRDDFFKIQKNSKTIFICFARSHVLFSKTPFKWIICNFEFFLIKFNKQVFFCSIDQEFILENSENFTDEKNKIVLCEIVARPVVKILFAPLNRTTMLHNNFGRSLYSFHRFSCHFRDFFKQIMF